MRGRNDEVIVPKEIIWPHEYVLSGSAKERVQYDQLSLTQWVTGFCHIMREKANLETRQHMLDYMIALMDDADDFLWDAAKASHAVLLCRMEQGEIKHFGKLKKIDRVRRANAQTHVNPSQGSQNSKKSVTPPSRSMPYLHFNQGNCSYTTNHETRGVMYKHICSECFTSFGKVFGHHSTECWNKLKKQSKTSKIDCSNSEGSKFD